MCEQHHVSLSPLQLPFVAPGRSAYASKSIRCNGWWLGRPGENRFLRLMDVAMQCS